jgi:hypothetical protein
MTDLSSLFAWYSTDIRLVFDCFTGEKILRFQRAGKRVTHPTGGDSDPHQNRDTA